MSEVTLESQLIDIIKDKEMPEHVKMAKLDMLVTLGVDVNAKDDDGNTSLMAALSLGDKEIAEFLIENSANIDEKNKDGETALIKIANLGNKEMVEFLVSRGADVNFKAECTKAEYFALK